MRASAALCLAPLWLVAACHPAGSADAASCTPPPTWPAAGAKPGQPDAEFAACLADRAWRARALAIPVESAANGVLAQCQIEVDRFENVLYPNRTDDQDRDQLDQATAAVTAARKCSGR